MPLQDVSKKSSLSFHPVCGRILSLCSVLKYWLENEKQEVQKYYTSQQWHQILLSCYSLKSSDGNTTEEWESGGWRVSGVEWWMRCVPLLRGAHKIGPLPPQSTLVTRARRTVIPVYNASPMLAIWSGIRPRNPCLHGELGLNFPFPTSDLTCGVP